MIKIGIQGGKGSTNEHACLAFAQKYNWQNLKIEYLITTESVLSALENKKIDLGTFAWSSSNVGLVKETQEAIKKYNYEKIDEIKLQLDHVLLSNSKISLNKSVNIFSHPQALKAHKKFLIKYFTKIRLVPEKDTAAAAKKLKAGNYPPNSLVIAPKACAEIYNLKIFTKDLPSNKNYKTTIFLVRKRSKKE